MREILFRGKRKENGYWIDGGCFEYRNFGGEQVYNICHNGHTNEVIPETVGQFTGLTDKNGNKVFEGDIVKWGINYTVAFMCTGYVLKKDMNPKMYDYSLMAFNGTELEVIGNIYDNPELLGGEQK